ncbi:hypothetical protein TNCV_704071 [Trichonephila clavipes]|nr:hypothetical protein TNCV_704071 [Trichonephila clavipes]
MFRRRECVTFLEYQCGQKDVSSHRISGSSFSSITTSVEAVKWHDKKDVSKMSSVYTVEKVEFEDTKKKKKKLKSKIVHDYNNTMGGVDKVDQHLTDYLVARK